MLLRSSSTPVLGSLISSVAESPNNNHVEVNFSAKRIPSPLQNHHKVSFHLPGGSQNLGSVSCNSSPIFPAPSERPGHDGMKGILRSQSAGNLEELGSGSCNNFDEFYCPQRKASAGRHKSSVLETIPSFSFHNCKDKSEDEYGDSDDEYDIEGQWFEEQQKLFGKSFGGDEKAVHTMAGEFGSQKRNLGLVDEEQGMTEKFSYEEKMERASKEMYLALGIGINGGGMSGFTGHGGGNPGAGDFFSHDSGKGNNNNEIEEHYKKMVSENPESALTLSNYAQFLYQSKRDLKGAEEYFSRAILLDPNDGEILAQYGKLIWELYRDEDRAMGYFDRAVQAASEESHVHAAYASFLWETEEEENEENDAAENHDTMVPNFKQSLASVGA